MQKILAVVQARMGSSRLPGKIAKNIADKPILAHLITRLKRAHKLNQIVVATSRGDIDDRVVDIAASEGVECYRGSEDDVLSRYLEAGRKYQADTLVRITGDCPLIDPVTVDEIITDFLNSDVSYMRQDAYPRGLDTEVFYYDTLCEAARMIKKESSNKKPYREHVTLYIYQHPEWFKIAEHTAPESLRRDYRLCVDEEADFELIKKIYNKLYSENKGIIDIHEVIDLLDKDYELAQMNRNVEQKKV